jgi:hypothetical protein
MLALVLALAACGRVDSTPVDAATVLDGAAPVDAAPVDAVPVDAAPIVQTFSVGLECSGYCKGGYGGQKITPNPNSDWLCTTHGFPRSLSYTISSNQPGGRFCVYIYPSNPPTFGCDSSCSGCNPMDSVTCSNP